MLASLVELKAADRIDGWFSSREVGKSRAIEANFTTTDRLMLKLNKYLCFCFQLLFCLSLLFLLTMQSPDTLLKYKKKKFCF